MGDYQYDADAVNRVINFIERYCVSPETGKLIVLQPWQREHIESVYGYRDEDGLRRCRTWWAEIPKKQGKSALSSCLALYHLCADSEKSAEVYSVAGSAKQASIIFETAKAMVKASPALSKIIRPYKLSLIHSDSGSRYECLSSESSTADGIKASCILFDEIHEQKDRRLWDTLRGSGLSRRQPLTIVTTTAGWDRTSIAWELHDYALRVRDKKHVDDRWHVSIYAADEADPVDSEETWAKANPNLGVTVSLDDFAALYHEAVAAGPGRLNSWKRYHLNLWTAQEAAWIPMLAWSKCSKEPIDIASLVGRTAYYGIDTSSTIDLTAVVLLFPTPDGGYELLAYHFMPRGCVIEAEQRDKQPYRAWAAQGYLDLTEGDAIDLRTIHKRLRDLMAKYPPANREVALDARDATGLIQQLQSEGWEPVTVSPKGAGMSAPSKELIRLVTDLKLDHGSNPLLTWQAQSASVIEDVDGYIRPVKGRGANRKRIDGIVATAIALSRAMIHVNEPPKAKSVYETRGILRFNQGAECFNS